MLLYSPASVSYCWGSLWFQRVPSISLFLSSFPCVLLHCSQCLMRCSWEESHDDEVVVKRCLTPNGGGTTVLLLVVVVLERHKR